MHETRKHLSSQKTAETELSIFGFLVNLGQIPSSAIYLAAIRKKATLTLVL